MWLIDTTTLKLQEFPTEAGLKYAILSHRWGCDEVLFKDLNGSKDLNLLESKQGFSKVKRCCEQARRNGLLWAWVDTCCIDKSSSAELSEAINSMFHWYRESTVCYAYLVDVDDLDEIGGSEWFKRGWTLQELLAPTHVWFFNRDWTFLFEKHSLTEELRAITSIPEKALLDFQSKDYCVADKMSWAAGRQTTREEDLAYCLMGLFDINMPLLYGERTKAFRRLQEMIMDFSTDLSIFLWSGLSCAEYALLAASPSCFCVKPPESSTHGPPDKFNLSKGWTRNNAGVSIRLRLSPHHINKDQKAVFVASLKDVYGSRYSGYGIFLERLERHYRKGHYRRVSVDNQTTIDLATLTKRVYYRRISDFVTDLLIITEPIIPLSSTGSSRFTVIWNAPEYLEARVCQRFSDQERTSLRDWQVIVPEPAPTDVLFFDYTRTKAYGILGYLLISISNSLHLLACFGYDSRLRPICIVVICAKEFYYGTLLEWNVMFAYDNLLGDKEEGKQAFDHATMTYALRSPEHVEQFDLFNCTISLFLDIDTVKLSIYQEFLEQQREQISPIVERQQALFGMNLIDNIHSIISE